MIRCLAHGVLVSFKAPFTQVVKALESVSPASNVYLEVVETKPRVAVAVGEKYFLRAGNYLVATTIVLEGENETLVKIVASGGRRSLLDLGDLEASKDYARLVFEELARILDVEHTIISEVNYLEKSRSEALYFKVTSK